MIKLIKVNEKAKEVTSDGNGILFKPVAVRTEFRRDFKAIACYHTGYQIIFDPEEIGLVYDTSNVCLMSLVRLSPNIVDNNGYYPQTRDGKETNCGFTVIYEAHTPFIYTCEEDYPLFGILPIKKSAAASFNIETRIIPDITPQPNKTQSPQVQPRQAHPQQTNTQNSGK